MIWSALNSFTESSTYSTDQTKTRLCCDADCITIYTRWMLSAAVLNCSSCEKFQSWLWLLRTQTHARQHDPQGEILHFAWYCHALTPASLFVSVLSGQAYTPTTLIWKLMRGATTIGWNSTRFNPVTVHNDANSKGNGDCNLHWTYTGNKNKAVCALCTLISDYVS